MPAAKDCIFESHNNKYLYEQRREVRQDDDVAAVCLCNSLYPCCDSDPESTAPVPPAPSVSQPYYITA